MSPSLLFITDISVVQAEVGEELDGGGDVSHEVQLGGQPELTATVPMMELHAEVHQPLESLRVIDETGEGRSGPGGSYLL